MNKNRLSVLSICFILSSLLVGLLFTISYKINHRKNGFIRLFHSHAVSSQKELDIRFNSFYIAGLTSGNIFLGNLTAPVIWWAKANLLDTQSSKIMLPDIKTNTPESFRLTIDSPLTFVIDRLTTAVYSGPLFDSCKFLIKLDKTQFLEAVPLSSSSIVYRIYRDSLRQSILVKASFKNTIMTKKIFRLDKFNEGIFSTDGSLVYNHFLGKLVYTYFYRNQFAVIDSNLNLIYNGKTIDTISTPKIKVAEITSARVTTMAAPPLIVNRNSAVHGNWLYINSGLKANNENYETFSSHSVIDVYSILNGRYKLSFCLPEYNHKKLSDFRVTDNRLIAVYDHLLVVYELNLHLD